MGNTEILILAGALVGGYVNGLTGFGTGLTALVFWLQAVPPVVAAPLVLICSIVAHVQTLPAIRHAIVWRRVLPFVLGGLVGVPIGTTILPHVPVQQFKLFVGGLLIVYCSFMLLRRASVVVAWGGRFVDGAVGLCGGILGGLAGLSGVLPTIWVSLRAWDKDEKRAVIQVFNMSILSFAAASQAFGGLMTIEVARLAAVALPGTLLGVWMGRKTYDRLGNSRFNQVVLVLLLLAGVSIIVTWVHKALTSA